MTIADTTYCSVPSSRSKSVLSKPAETAEKTESKSR